MRILFILTAYQLCARAGEAEFANLDRVEHDSLVQSVFFKVPQEKVDKWKVGCMRIVVQGSSEFFVNPADICPRTVRVIQILSELFLYPADICPRTVRVV